MASSKCKNLSNPYVTLSFDVREVDGSLTHHTCEMSYEQFQVSKHRIINRK